MSLEGQLLDRKSLRSFTDKTAGWPALDRSSRIGEETRAAGRARCWGAGDEQVIRIDGNLKGAQYFLTV